MINTPAGAALRYTEKLRGYLVLLNSSIIMKGFAISIVINTEFLETIMQESCLKKSGLVERGGLLQIKTLWRTIIRTWQRFSCCSFCYISIIQLQNTASLSWAIFYILFTFKNRGKMYFKLDLFKYNVLVMRSCLLLGTKLQFILSLAIAYRIVMHIYHPFHVIDATSEIYYWRLYVYLFGAGKFWEYPFMTVFGVLIIFIYVLVL